MSDSFTVKNGVLTEYTGSGKSVTVPSDVAEIGAGAFSGNKLLTEVCFEGEVKIGEHAFEKCTSLRIITFNKKPSKIMNYAFRGCRSLREINGLDDCDMPFIAAYAFEGCGRDDGDGYYLIGTRLFNTAGDCVSDTFKIRDNVKITAVMPRALKKIRAKKIVIPDGVKYLGSSILSDCPTSIILPDSLEYISVQAFCDSYYLYPEYCSDKVFSLLPREWKKRYILHNTGRLTAADKNAVDFLKTKLRDFMLYFVEYGDAAALNFAVETAKPALELANELAARAAELGNAEINAILIYYIQTSFSSEEIAAADEKETEIALGLREKSVAEWRKQFKFKYIDGGILITDIVKPCNKLFIPEKIGKKEVVKLQFYKLEGVETVYVPWTVKTVDCGSFVACKDLKTVYISNGIEKIESGAFMFCSKIKEVYIPSGVKSIDKEAFDAASILKNIPFNLPIFSKPKITVITEHGSCAERFANENGYHIEYIK